MSRLRKIVAVSFLLLIFLSVDVRASFIALPVGSMDVVIVICNNENADAWVTNRLAADRFVSLASLLDSRIGFIMNSSTVVAQRGLTDSSRFRRELQDEILNAPEPAGNCNINDNITTALNMIATRVDTMRQAAVVVISCGNLCCYSISNELVDIAVDTMASISIVYVFNSEMCRQGANRIVYNTGGIAIEADARILPYHLENVFDYLTSTDHYFFVQAMVATQYAFTNDDIYENLEVNDIIDYDKEADDLPINDTPELVTNMLTFAIITGLGFVLALGFVMLKRPKISCPMSHDGLAIHPRSKLLICMRMPKELDAYTPPMHKLVLPNRRGKITLHNLIMENLIVSTGYEQAFKKIEWFSKGTKIRAKTKTLLQIKFPKNSKYKISVDGEDKNTVLINREGLVCVQITNKIDSGVYSIDFGDDLGRRH